MRKLYLESEISGSRLLHALLTASDVILTLFDSGQVINVRRSRLQRPQNYNNNNNKQNNETKKRN